MPVFFVFLHNWVWLVERERKGVGLMTADTDLEVQSPTDCRPVVIINSMLHWLENCFFGTVVVQLKNLVCVCLMSILLNSNLHFYNNVHFEHLISTVKNWLVLDCLKLKCLSLWLQCVVNMKQIIFSYFNSKK